MTIPLRHDLRTVLRILRHLPINNQFGRSSIGLPVWARLAFSARSSVRSSVSWVSSATYGRRNLTFISGVGIAITRRYCVGSHSPGWTDFTSSALMLPMFLFSRLRQRRYVQADAHDHARTSVGGAIGFTAKLPPLVPLVGAALSASLREGGMDLLRWAARSSASWPRHCVMPVRTQGCTFPG